MTMALAAASVIGIGGIGSALIGGNAAQNAASTQANMSMQQFQQIKQMLAPFVQGGTNAFNMQGNIAGANGYGAQQGAIQNIENGPLFSGMNKLGQDAILQNAAATGGLHTGNTNAALAQFTPNLLNQLLQQQFGNLGSLSALGESAGAQTGAFGANAANTAGSALAGGALAQGQQYQGMVNSLGQAFGKYQSLGGNFTNPFGNLNGNGQQATLGPWSTNVF